MAILGLDPGLATAGYGIITTPVHEQPELVACGVIRTPPDRGHAERLSILHGALNKLIDQHSPDRAAIEELYFNRNVKSALVVGEARGVLNLTLVQRSIPISEYNPGTVKKTIAGHGSADKKAVQQSVRRDLSLNTLPSPDDAADALAVAMCELYHARSGVPDS